ncbi:MarR family winged helix-turn-helix transcriptional regulator [Falsiroseomonas oryziterrae]|uniref:MarR family winged helix-turn-helix transcriptional regulator n=1 Tax=Falsiroseomonas oryziterrae TaxID=2911368 RepID=UPI001F3C8020|nr:MarR family winged helix-turn-helix transcriptional regulator [Roseomonas sp. NPKOSM-4]
MTISPPLPAGVPPVHHRPLHLVRRLQQIGAALLAETLRPHGLFGLEYGVLATLAEEPGIDQRRLAEAMGVDRNSAGQMVEALEARGLLTREVDPADRRARVLRLTASGVALRNAVRPAMLSVNARLVEPLPQAERDAFLSMLLRVVDHHEALARPGAGRRPRGAARSATRPAEGAA